MCFILMPKANLFWCIENMNDFILQKEAMDYIIIQWFKKMSYKAYMDSDFRKKFLELAEINRQRLVAYNEKS